jgi:hypothetical protein
MRDRRVVAGAPRHVQLSPFPWRDDWVKRFSMKSSISI